MPTSQTFTLNIDARPRIAGESIDGTLTLDAHRAEKDGLQNIIVRLEGVVRTKITPNGEAAPSTRHTVLLLSCEQELWTRSHAASVKDVTTLPFRFHLPADLPSSASVGGRGTCGSIAYSLEVVARRTGRLRSPLRAKMPITVQSTADSITHDVSADLQSGDWTGHWRKIFAERPEEHNPRVQWGARSPIRAELCIPDVRVVPASTAIPFRLALQTDSKRLAAAPGNVQIFLDRQALVRTETRCRQTKETLRNTKGSGRATENIKGGPSSGVEEEIRVHGTEWVRGPNGQFFMDGHFVCNVAPTTRTASLSFDYILRLRVSSSNTVGKLKLDLPVVLGSAGRHCGGDEPFLPGYQAVDAPPAYWDVRERHEPASI